MGKRGRKVTLRTVLTVGSARQGMLFADSFTDIQQQVLELADGTRTIMSIIRLLKEPRNKIMRIVRDLCRDGYLVAAEPEAVCKVCAAVLAEGRLEDAIGLYRFVQQNSAATPEVLLELAELYVRTARVREASLLYTQLAREYAQQSRFGQALMAQRKAAGLQPGNYKVQAELAALCLKTGRSGEAARVWRMYALRLAGIGEYQQALDIIDNAVGRIGGNDTLFYAEAEILALMEGKATADDIALGAEESAKLNVESWGDTEPVADGSSSVASRAEDEYDSSELLIPGNESIIDPHTADTENSEIILGDEAEEEFRVQAAVGKFNLERRESPAVSGRFGSRLFSVLLGVIVLLVVLTAVNYYYRSRMYSAVLKSRGIGSLVQTEGLVRQLEIAEDALAVLENNKPPLNFMQSSEYKNQLSRIRQLVADKNGELLSNNVAFDRVLQEWSLKHTPELAAKIDSFRNGSVVSSERGELAEVAYRNWLEEKDQKLREREDSIKVLADKTLEPKVRFLAYRKLLLDFPEVFENDYPKGVRNLTVPSRIHAEIAGSGKEVPLELQGAQQGTQGFWEIPVRQKSNVYIVHPGYFLAGEEEGTVKTRMPYPLTFEQFFVLHKSPVIALPLLLNFVPEKGLVFGAGRRLLLSSREDYALADLNSGRVVSRKSFLRAENRQSRSPGMNIVGFGDWAGVLNDGVFYLGESQGGGEFELKPLKAPIAGDIRYATLVALEVGRYDGAGVILTGTKVSGKSSQSPVSIIEAGTGREVWGQTALTRELFRKIKKPVVYMVPLAWNYLLVTEDGSVILVRENGDVVKEFALNLNAGVRLRADMVRLCRSETGDYLFVAGRVFLLVTSEEPEISELWQVPDASVGRGIPSDSGIVWHDERELRLYSLSNGERLFSYRFAGRLVQEPVVVRGVIYLLEEKNSSGRAELVALDTGVRSEPELWTYPMNSAVRLMFGSENMLGVLTVDGIFSGFVR